jgi:hypothetical protein
MLSLLFPLGLGIFFYFAKPISINGGSRFRILEVTLSCIIAVSGLIRLILQ